ncbi:hypothetical protein PSYMO_18688 [Pseudomonas amygdali pv. mori str. 301020]|uniref:Uncharacterized protein n=1 Tax=Pseudomonas amygdali pv. mori str. 301020 TaxID=629261 RepID=A0A656GCP9_PSEA0|nr:hypothetical protein PSYMO_18688 [Pseudomonas amygdali pv. mori str. 301020]
MTGIILLLGFIAVLPGYIVSLEERLLSEKKFYPLSVVVNIRRSLRCRKFLSFFGLALLFFGWLSYPVGPSDELSIRDRMKLLGMALVLWSFFVYGFAREKELERGGVIDDHYSCMRGVPAKDWLSIVLKATKSFALLCLLGVIPAAISYIMERV